MEKQYYKTTNFYLASFLFAKGMELVNIDRITDDKRSTFVFVDKPEIEELSHNFNFSQDDVDDVLVDARKFVYAIKTLKDKLYQSRF
jgi:hypothetical protein